MFTEVFVDATCWNATQRLMATHNTFDDTFRRVTRTRMFYDVTSQNCPQGMEASGEL